MSWAILREPTLLVTAAVFGALGFIVLGSGIVGIALAPFLFASIWRYGYSVLRAVARGHKRVPPPEVGRMNPFGEWGVFWHFVFFLPGIVIATFPFQPIGAVVALLVAIAFPASAAIMGLTSSLRQAFNPAGLIAIARTLGAHYWALVLGYVGIFGGMIALQPVLRLVFGYMSPLGSLIVGLWALLVSFALIGSALRAHRLDFEIAGEVVPAEDRRLREQHDEWHERLDVAYASFRSGASGTGYKTLRELVDANGDSLEINHWLVENMLEWRDKRFGIEVAKRLMPRLLASGDAAGALELYRRCRRHAPDYRPPPAEAEQIAACAMAFGQTGIANELGYNRKPTSSH